MENAMSDARPPIGDLLEDAMDEGAVRRMWDGVRARRSASGHVTGARRWTWAVVAGSAAATAAAAALLLASGGPPVSPAGPLRLTDGTPFSGAITGPPSTAVTRIALDDGSFVTLAAGARLEV